MKIVKAQVHTKGKLTVATDSPAYPPWFVDNAPSNAKGYESAVAYAIALKLGFKHAAVTWYTEPYAASLLSGPKPFDFDINEITYSKALTSSVAFSSSYFSVNESAIALKTSKIVTKHSSTALKGYVYGAIAKSPSVAFIKGQIKASHAPVTFATIPEAVAALKLKRIAAFIIDTPTGQYQASTNQLGGAVQFAQFKANATHYALLSQLGNPLVTCVNTALRSMTSAGTLSKLSKQYLAVFNSIPFIAP